jgi:hypothetical protein
MINLSLLYSVRKYRIDRRENLLLTTSLCAEQMEFEKSAFCKAFFLFYPFPIDNKSCSKALNR